MLGYFNPNLGQMDKPKYWVKNVIKNVNPTSIVHFFNDIFNPTFGFVHLTQIWVQILTHYINTLHFDLFLYFHLIVLAVFFNVLS